jgi:hypothetical protein
MVIFTPSAQAQTVAPPDSTWFRFANEGEVKPLDLKQIMRYGADTRWIEKETQFTPFECNNTTFGVDPAPGVAKSCWYRIPQSKCSPRELFILNDPAAGSPIFIDVNANYGGTSWWCPTRFSWQPDVLNAWKWSDTTEALKAELRSILTNGTRTTGINSFRNKYFTGEAVDTEYKAFVDSFRVKFWATRPADPVYKVAKSTATDLKQSTYTVVNNVFVKDTNVRVVQDTLCECVRKNQVTATGRAYCGWAGSNELIALCTKQ